MPNPEIERQILSAVGGPVHFQYPGTEGPRQGVLKDRVVVQSRDGAQGVLYWDVVDLIEFPDDPEPLWMRVGYYRYAKGRLVWGNRPLTDPLSVWQGLFAAAKTRSWFPTVSEQKARDMTITVQGVYEGDGLVKLDQPVSLKAKTKVHVTIETDSPSPDDDDPTGWKTADELIGFMQDGPQGPVGAEHDEHLYRKK